MQIKDSAEKKEPEETKKDPYFYLSIVFFVITGIFVIVNIVLSVKRSRCNTKLFWKHMAAAEVFRNKAEEIKTDMSDAAQQEIIDTIRRQAIK